MIGFGKNRHSVFHIKIGKFQQTIAAQAVFIGGWHFGFANVHAPAMISGGSLAAKIFSARAACFHRRKYNSKMRQKHCEKPKHLKAVQAEVVAPTPI